MTKVYDGCENNKRKSKRIGLAFITVEKQGEKPEKRDQQRQYGYQETHHRNWFVLANIIKFHEFQLTKS